MANAVDRGMRHAVEYLPDRLYYVALNAHPSAQSQRHFFTIDNEMIYWNFYLDFGPLNLGHVYRFCILMNKKLNDPKLKDKIIFYYSSEHPHKRTNAAFLISAWAMLCLNKSPEDAFKPFRSFHLSFPPWHDATPTACHFNLTILDTLRGLQRAREYKWFDFQNFDVEEYEYYEQVENGDLNWIMDKRFIAFAGPHAERKSSPGGYYNLRPEDYVPYFKRKNVNLVVRLNKAYYDSRKFTSQGIGHMELYFLDGSNPSEAILNKFITRAEETGGGIAVHCKAGLGRTGTCIGAYMMKHFKVTAEEMIGWLRVVRPGSIIGPQQQFMKDIQHRMWRDGDLMRTRLHQLPALSNGSGSNKEANGNDQQQQQPPQRKSSRSGSTAAGAVAPAPAPSPTAPTTPQSSLLARRMNKMSVGGSPGASSGHSPTAAAGSAALLSPSVGGTTRPGSRGNIASVSPGASPASSGVGLDTVVGTGTPTQGDYLRLRRAQQMQAAAGGGGGTAGSGTDSNGGTPTSGKSPSGRKGFTSFLSFNR